MSTAFRVATEKHLNTIREMILNNDPKRAKTELEAVKALLDVTSDGRTKKALERRVTFLEAVKPTTNDELQKLATILGNAVVLMKSMPSYNKVRKTRAPKAGKKK